MSQNKKQKPLRRAASTQLLCKNCRVFQRSRPGVRNRVGASVARSGSTNRHHVVSAMYGYLMTSWDELPDQNKRALGFDFVVGSEGEEAALKRLAGIFMEYADVALRRALVARRRRLGFAD